MLPIRSWLQWFCGDSRNSQFNRSGTKRPASTLFVVSAANPASSKLSNRDIRLTGMVWFAAKETSLGADCAPAATNEFAMRSASGIFLKNSSCSVNASGRFSCNSGRSAVATRQIKFLDFSDSCSKRTMFSIASKVAWVSKLSVCPETKNSSAFTHKSHWWVVSDNSSMNSGT